MTLGPTLILACPHCSGPVALGTFASGNNFGAVLWSDGYLDAPMLPGGPEISPCGHCRRLFWVEDADRIGEIPRPMERWPDEGEEPPPNPPEEWLNAPRARHLEIEELLAAIRDGAARDAAELEYLRLTAWRMGNDWARERRSRRRKQAKPHVRSGAELANMEALLEQYRARGGESLVLAAELARELGRFEEALSLLAAADIDGWEDLAALVRERAAAGDSLVAALPLEMA